MLQKLLIILSVILLLSACGTANVADGRLSKPTNTNENNPKMTPNNTSTVDSRIVEASNQFGLNLFQQLTQIRDENVFISPISISMAIAMAYQGTDSATKEEIGNALGWNNSGLTVEEINDAYYALLQSLIQSKDGVEINIANALWTREGEKLYQSFLEANQLYYNAKVKELDFDRSDSVKTINRWVKDETKGKIDKIIEGPIAPNTILFIMNAIYFKGDWSNEFDENKTEQKSFTLSDGSTIPVPMMAQYGKYEYRQDSDFQAIRLPYGNGEKSMLIVLPAQNTSVDTVIENIAEDPTQWQQSITKRSGEIQLPRFTMEYENSLVDALQALGIQNAFDPSTADFTNMSDRNDLYISEVKHKSIIEVNEKGSEAAAVTSIEVTTTSAIVEEEPFQMIVDRPFFFAIEDRKTGAWLFIGAVRDLR